MPGTCSVCVHPDRRTVDEAIVGRVPYRDIVRRHEGLSISAVSRHRQRHLTPALVVLAAEQERDHGETLLAQLQALYRRVRAILDAAERDGSPATALSAVREARQLLESIGRVTGELDDRPQVQVVNLAASQEWQALQVLILRALAPFPEARLAVAGALRAEPPRELVS